MTTTSLEDRITDPEKVPVVVEKPFTTVENYDPKDKAQAYDLYLNSDMDIVDISIKLGIQHRVIASWAREGKWSVKRQELEQEMMKRADSKYRKFLVEHRIPTLQRHLEISTMMEEQIRKILQAAEQTGKPVNTQELKRLADSMSASSMVSARASGIAEKLIERTTDSSGSGQGKRPMIAIGITPTLAGGGVDVKVVETETGDNRND